MFCDLDDGPPAPELLRAAMRVGVEVSWERETGECYARVTDNRSRRQRAAFEALMANMYAPYVLYGEYYAGDYTGLQ
jgi:hypothetical protein